MIIKYSFSDVECIQLSKVVTLRPEKLALSIFLRTYDCPFYYITSLSYYNVLKKFIYYTLMMKDNKMMSNNFRNTFNENQIYVR